MTSMVKSKYSILKERLWILLILSFRSLEQNIHSSGQYENCDWTNEFIRSFLLLNGIIRAIRARVVNFPDAFLQMLFTWVLNFRFLSTVTPKSFSSTLSQTTWPPTRTYTCSTAVRGPSRIKWHLSGLSIMKFSPNQETTAETSSSKFWAD